jgi:hypothetical protein
VKKWLPQQYNGLLSGLTWNFFFEEKLKEHFLRLWGAENKRACFCAITGCLLALLACWSRTILDPLQQ